MANSSQSTERVLFLPDQALAPFTELEPGLRRQVQVHSNAMMLVRHEMTKGWQGDAHSHRHEQMYVVRGSLRVRIKGVSL